MLTQQLAAALRERRKKQLYRHLDARDGAQGAVVMYQGESYLSFCSNDYLGLANHPEVIQAFKKAADLYGVGSGASHLLSGHCDVHRALEEDLAAFLNYPAALLFSTGYMANLGVINTFAKSGDLLLQDHNNHASLIDAGLLAKAEMRRYRHNNCEHLASLLISGTQENKFIVTQGVFSMSGELAKLPEIVQLAKINRACLVLDDAHGLGCVGTTGRGVMEHYHLAPKDVPLLIGTLGKAFGSFGAFVVGEKSSIEALRQFARTYIYTTALPPAVCAASRASLALLQKEKWRLQHLTSLIAEFRHGAAQLGLNIKPSTTAIQSLTVGDEAKALALSQQLLNKGILIKAIRYPTVALGQAGLRISLSAAHSSQQINQLLDALNAL